jgi:hypothetical protein
MKTKSELEQDIIRMTMHIQSEFPELLKYIPEMPDNVTETDSIGINTKSLMEYYNSLEELLREYLKTHNAS